MSILTNIAAKLRGHGCEKMVKRVGNEMSLTLPAVEITAKINVGVFSNKIVELVRASEIAVALDNSQYLICKMIHNTNDRKLRTTCERIYLQVVMSLTQLEAIFETIKIDSDLSIRTELLEWIRYCGSLNKHAIEVLSPGASGKGPYDVEVDDIMAFQEISESDMKAALSELER